MSQEQAERRVQQECDAGDPEAQSRYDEYLMAARRSLRAERSRPLIDELDAWRKSQKPMPGSALDEALVHLDRRREHMEEIRCSVFRTLFQAALGP